MTSHLGGPCEWRNGKGVTDLQDEYPPLRISRHEAVLHPLLTLWGYWWTRPGKVSVQEGQRLAGSQ